ncbi:MAG: hypothetical protein E6G01_01830 [Actinobacteria bacterium]|nr:MAG: hypothetical protein E6G01_01830 [Actinomycetota bacterium]
MAVEPASEAQPKRDGRALVKKLDWRVSPERSVQEEHDRFEAAVQRVIDAPAGTSDKTQREELFHLFLRLVAEIEASLVKSTEKRRQSRTWSRGLVAVSSLAAALAGLALALNYHGFGSRAFGIAVAVIGTWSTISTSLRLDEQYEANSRKNRIYTRLLREVQLYLLATFPNVTVEQAAARFGKFSREYDNADPVEKPKASARSGSTSSS